MLVRCRECANHISTQAPSCPHCGVPEPWRGVFQQPEQASPAPAPTPEERPERTQPTQEALPEGDYKSSRGELLIIGVVVFLVGLVVVLFVGDSSQRSNSIAAWQARNPQSAARTAAEQPPPAPDNTATWLDSASRSRFEAGDYSRAIYYAKQILDFFPDSAQAESATELVAAARAQHARLRATALLSEGVQAQDRTDQLIQGASIYMVASQFGVSREVFSRYSLDASETEVLQAGGGKLGVSYPVPTAEACRIGAAVAVHTWATLEEQLPLQVTVLCTNHWIVMKLRRGDTARLEEYARSDKKLIYRYP